MSNQWAEVGFSEAFADMTKGHNKTRQADYLTEGSYPIVDQGQNLIGGYSNDDAVISHLDLPIIVFGDHTRCIKYIDFPFGPGADGTKLLRAQPGVDPRYGYHCLRQIKIPETGYARHFKFLKSATIPLPPIEEQRRIAAVLDAADDLRTKRRQALAKLDTLTQAIFIDMFGDPLAEPVSSLLGDLATFVGGGTPSKSKPEYFNGDICWATSKDMRGRFIDDTQDHITSEAIASSATKLGPAGTVLVVVKSKVLAHRLPVAITRVPTCFGQDLKGIVCSDDYPAEFIAGSLRAGERWLLSRARGVNTEGLTLDQLRRLPIAKTSRSERRSFVESTKFVEAFRRAANSQAATQDTLFASLQQRAFSGEL